MNSLSVLEAREPGVCWNRSTVKHGILKIRSDGTRSKPTPFRLVDLCLVTHIATTNTCYHRLVVHSLAGRQGASRYPTREAVIDMVADVDRSEGPWTPSGRCTIFVCDIASYGDPDRVDYVQRYLREELYKSLAWAFDESRIPFDACYHEDRGDGAIVIPPPGTGINIVLSSVVQRIDAALRRQHELASPVARIQLRVGIHAGEIHPDDHGLAGTALNHAFRILEAPEFKQLANGRAARLSIIVSSQVYDDVDRHGMGSIDPTVYQPIAVQSKETKTTSWVQLLGGTRQPPGTALTELHSTVPRSNGNPPEIDVRTGSCTACSISPHMLFELVEHLLDLPLMTTERGRDQVVNALRDDISRMIPRQPEARLDTYCIVRTCIDHPGGLEELIATLRSFVGGSVTVEQIERVVTHLSR
jgi:hypothetical protein